MSTHEQELNDGYMYNGETRKSSIPVELPPMGTSSPEQDAAKSATHWVWTPYLDINNMAPWGIRSLLGYRGQAWSLFKRCTPYPLGNMVQTETDRATVAELSQSGFNVNFNAETIPKLEIIKYAGEQAHELGETYGEEQGLRILKPLVGMDDAELVNRIIQVVQPFAYLIHEMPHEFTKGARGRIKDSNLSKDESKTAFAVAEIMNRGAERARIKATSEYRALITSMSDASIGKPGISEPNDFHEWICIQLDKPVPKRVNRMEQQQTQGGMDSGLIKALLERDAERAKELDALKVQVAENAAQKRGPGRPPLNREAEA